MGKKNKSAQDFRWGAGQTSPWYFQAGKGWIRLVWYFCTAELAPTPSPPQFNCFNCRWAGQVPSPCSPSLWLLPPTAGAPGMDQCPNTTRGCRAHGGSPPALPVPENKINASDQKAPWRGWQAEPRTSVRAFRKPRQCALAGTAKPFPER